MVTTVDFLHVIKRVTFNGHPIFYCGALEDNALVIQIENCKFLSTNGMRVQKKRLKAIFTLPTYIFFILGSEDGSGSDRGRSRSPPKHREPPRRLHDKGVALNLVSFIVFLFIFK